MKKIAKATWEIMKTEFGDKTFLIVFIFTLGWSNPIWTTAEGKKNYGPNYEPGHAVFADGHHFI